MVGRVQYDSLLVVFSKEHKFTDLTLSPDEYDDDSNLTNVQVWLVKPGTDERAKVLAFLTEDANWVVGVSRRSGDGPAKIRWQYETHCQEGDGDEDEDEELETDDIEAKVCKAAMSAYKKLFHEGFRNAKKAQRSLFKVEEEEYNHEFYAANNEDE
jgi:hypothetical protein